LIDVTNIQRNGTKKRTPSSVRTSTASARLARSWRRRFCCRAAVATAGVVEFAVIVDILPS